MLIRRTLTHSRKLVNKYNFCKYLHNKSHIDPQNVLILHRRELFVDIFPPASVSLPNDLTSRQCFYCGIDPTADSLHIGNLLPLIALLHCQNLGHDVIVVLGTATALIGDPSGHSSDRKILTREQIEKNANGIEKDINQIFSNYANEMFHNRSTKFLNELKILRNNEWYKEINVIDFFTTSARKFRMGFMLGNKFTKERLKSMDGLAASEFFYSVFQANDWLHLYNHHKCRFQIGGVDQLTNVHAGHDLIKRVHQENAFGLLVPIVTNHLGKKLGKSLGNTIYLDPNKTSPFELYQYFYKLPDSIVEKYLKYFTFIQQSDIDNIMKAHNKNPEKRRAQEHLAKQVCKLVHGKKGLESAERCTRILFNGEINEIETLNDDEIEATFSGMKIHKAMLEPETCVMDAIEIVKATKNRQQAEDIIYAGGVLLNGVKIKVPEQILLSGLHILQNNITLLTVGKNKHHIIKWAI